MQHQQFSTREVQPLLERVVPFVQDGLVVEARGRSGHLGQQHPGHRGVLRLRVLDKRVYKRCGKLLLSGPDAEGFTEVTAGERGKGLEGRGYYICSCMQFPTTHCFVMKASF